MSSNANVPPSVPPPQPASSTNGLAIASLVLGIIAIPMVFCYYIGVLPGIAALVLGLVARNQIKASGGTQGGGGLALAGVITGGIGVGLGVVMICMIVILALMGPAIGNIFSNITSNV